MDTKKGPKRRSGAEKVLAGEIARQRATVMEGVFGTHKDHYELRKIKVKGEKREKLMVLFATMAANAVKIAKRRTGDPPAGPEGSLKREKDHKSLFRGIGVPVRQMPGEKPSYKTINCIFKGSNCTSSPYAKAIKNPLRI